MSEFVDRLANWTVGWRPGNEDEAKLFIRELLAEMREAVTDEMAAPIAYNYLIRDADLKIAFQAMIDAALAPDKVNP